MITCTRKIEFDTAHRVIGHLGQCRMLHGHRYGLEATFTAHSLSQIGMIIDFGCIKEKLGKWLLQNWDHNTVLNADDKALGEYIAQYTGQKVYYLPYNPTAEYMADYLLNTVCPELFAQDNIVCIKIRLYETPNCYAEANKADCHTMAKAR